MSSSRDADGHFCGQVAGTDLMQGMPDSLCGYCGPECAHCTWPGPSYVIQDGVWVCAADFDYES